MNVYLEMKQRHQKEVNDFPIFFAFSKEQFETNIQKLGLKPTDIDKIYSIGAGGYIRKTDSNALKELFDRHNKERKQAIDTDDTFIKDMFKYELGNHEYVITCDVEDTLNALGLTIDEVNKSPRLRKALNKACKEQRDWYNKHG